MSSLPLLTDDQIAEFVRTGFLVQSFPDGPHAVIEAEILRLFGGNGNPDNAIYDELPGLQELLASDAVRGVLASLLGPEYRLQCHRHTHLVPVADPGTAKPTPRFHQDGTDREFKGWNRPWRRWHRPRRLNVFYYPHDVGADGAPTEVVGGSHYWGTMPPEAQAHTEPLLVSAGTLAFTHYNLWHRGTVNRCERPRVMVKFVVERCAEPTAPSWDNDPEYEYDLDAGASSIVSPGSHTRNHLWHWLCAGGDDDGGVPGSDAYSLWDLASTERESTATIEAAYELARHGAAAADATREPFLTADPATCERAALVLSAAGDEAVPLLTDGLSAEDEWIRATALDVLADLGKDGLDAAAAVVPCIDDPSPWVRHNLMQAIEVWGPLATDLRELALRGLEDETPHVCFNAMSALANTGVAGDELEAHLRPLCSHEHDQVAWKAGDLLDVHDHARY